MLYQINHMTFEKVPSISSGCKARKFILAHTTLPLSDVTKLRLSLPVDTPLEEKFSLTGNALAFLSQSVATSDKAITLRRALSHSLDVFDVLFIAILGWTSVPISQFIYNKFFLAKFTKTQLNSSLEVSPDDSPFSFRKTYAYQIVDHISQAARIGSVVYLANVCRVMLNVLGYTKIGSHLVTQVAKAAYLGWAGRRIMIFKRHLIAMAVKAENVKELGKAAVYNRILDVMIVIITILSVSDALGLEMGRGINSLFAFGGIGTLVFSLASKDIATQLVSGLVISTSDRFYEGETINLGDGTKGLVTNIGWMETSIRGEDDIVVRIPNAQLVNQRFSNLSRLFKCQVKQKLRFSYDEIHKLPELVQAIKFEIKSSCPKLITDGSRPFRVHWREFQDDHLEVVIDSHFNLPPTGNVYWENRQKVLEAISRATKKCGVSFAIPSSIIINRVGPSLENDISSNNNVQ